MSTQPLTLPGIKLSNTGEILTKDTRLAMLLWAASGRGKTRLAGSLHRLTMKYLGKPTLFIAVESGEGGGAVTIRDMNVPLWIPKDWGDLDRGLTSLKSDRQFGGVVLDSASEVVKAFVKPVALKYPCREKSAVVVGPRSEGIPTQSDYQVMGELMRQLFQKLLNISAQEDPGLRKHIVVTALDKSRQDEESKRTTWVGPALAGAIATDGVGMFQLAATIELKSVVEAGRRTVERWLVSSSEGPEALKDRFNLLPGRVLIKNMEGTKGMDLCDMWEHFWLPVCGGGEVNGR